MQDTPASSRTITLAFLCALLFWTTSAQAQLADSTWPMFMHDLRHTGRAAVNVNGPSTNAVGVKWKHKFQPRLKTSPTIGADGTIYLGAGFKPLCAVNPANGAEKWCTTGGGDASISSPTVGSDGTIYIGARDNKLWAVRDNGANPTVLWTYKIPLDGDVMSSPSLDPTTGSNAVYMSCGCLSAGIVHALNKNTANPDGELIWKLQVGKSTRASAPAVETTPGTYYGTIYIGSTDGKLHALNPTGSLKWTSNVGGVNTNNSSPSIANDGTIYIGTNKGVAAVSPTGGNPQWSFNAGSSVSATPAIGTDGTIYFGTTKGAFYALNQTGALKWKIEGLNGEFRSSPAIGANGKIYAAGGKNVYCFNDNGGNGSIQWTFVTGGPIQWSSPAIGPDKTLYIGSQDHYLYALKEN